MRTTTRLSLFAALLVLIAFTVAGCEGETAEEMEASARATLVAEGKQAINDEIDRAADQAKQAGRDWIDRQLDSVKHGAGTGKDKAVDGAKRAGGWAVDKAVDGARAVGRKIASGAGATKNKAGDTARAIGNKLPGRGGDNKGNVIDYFALGDSIASGHGLMDDGRLADGSRVDRLYDMSACRRSAEKSYPGQVHAELKKRYDEVNFYHLACTGARAGFEVGHAVSNCEGQFDTYTYKQRMVGADCQYKALQAQANAVVLQLEANKRNGIKRPTLVSITIGANDFEFSSMTTLKPLLRGESVTWDLLILERTAAVRAGLSATIDALLAFDNVTIVVTDVHNPINPQSFLYNIRVVAVENNCVENTKGRPKTSLPGMEFNGNCHQQVEAAADRLNQTIEEVVASRQASGRVQLANVHDRFKSGTPDAPGPHWSPQRSPAPTGSTSCGEAPPEFYETWIQYSGDLLSNSAAMKYANVDGRTASRGNEAFDFAKNVVTGLRLDLWRGDCFHPNERGAQEYATVVNEAAIRLGR